MCSQIVLLLDLKQEEIIDDPDNVPEDLRHHIFDDSASVIEVSHRGSPDQRLHFDSSRMEFSGVFCMSCFHELYTQWKRERGLVKGNVLIFTMLLIVMLSCMRTISCLCSTAVGAVCV